MEPLPQLKLSCFSIRVLIFLFKQPRFCRDAGCFRSSNLALDQKEDRRLAVFRLGPLTGSLLTQMQYYSTFSTLSIFFIKFL